jgi:hypothetical protein
MPGIPYTWIDGTSGDWGMATDWSPNRIPTSVDNATANDYFVGDGGNDTFVFHGNTTGGNGNDVIADFGAHSLVGPHQADVIQFDSSESSMAASRRCWRIRKTTPLAMP